MPLSSLVDMFSTKVALHRVPLVDHDGKVVGCVETPPLVSLPEERLSLLSYFSLEGADSLLDRGSLLASLLTLPSLPFAV